MNRLFCLVLITTLASGFPIYSQDEKAPPRDFTNSIGMKFVWIPPGNFVMGSPAQEKEGVTVAPLRCQSEESFASDESTVGI